MADLSVAAVSAVVAASIATTGERRIWFALLQQTYENTDVASGWDTFAGELATAAPDAGVAESVVDEFLQAMADESNPLEAVAELYAAEVDELESTYVANLDPDGERVDDSYDEAAWAAALNELGARWDRTEESWDQFRVWFLYEATQRELKTPATSFVDYAESRDKAATFDEYGVPNPSAATTSEQENQFPEIQVGDSGDWVAYAERLLAEAGY